MIITLLLVLELLILLIAFYFISKKKMDLLTKFDLENQNLRSQCELLTKQYEEKNTQVMQLINYKGSLEAEVAFYKNIRDEKKLLDQKIEILNKELAREKEKVLGQEKLERDLKILLENTKLEITNQNREQYKAINDRMQKYTEEKGKELQKEAVSSFEKIIEKDVKDTMLKLQENLSLQQEKLLNLQKPVELVTKILSSSKDAGIYGEQTIANQLDAMGFRFGIDYLTQVYGKSNNEERLIADVVIIIPNSGKKDILIIDSKSSTKLGFGIAEFAASIESSVNTFAKKDYKSAVERKLKEDFKDIEINQTHLFIYFPFDRSLSRISEEKPELLKKIREKDIGILTPVILDFLLDTVKLYSAKLEMKEAEEAIMKDVKILIERTGKVLELVSDLGKSVGQTARKFQELKSSVKTRFVPTVNKMSKPLNIKPILFDGINEDDLKEIEAKEE